MATEIHALSSVDQKAQIGENVKIGPFCAIGPDVTIGDGCILDSHVTLTGQLTIGPNNRFWPNVVIGGEPQDKSWTDADTGTEIGADNQFREGVTVHRGAEKEDGITRIGNRNLLMSNAHVAHNCHVFDDTILVNGVLLGGHVHVHDGAIISGNSVVHHFSTIGTLAFISGGCRVPFDIPPYLLAAGSDDPQIKTLNLVGMRRRGIEEGTIRLVKKAFKLLYREHQKVEEVKATLTAELDSIPFELAKLLDFVEFQKKGKMGRGREAVRNAKPATASETKAA
ncbi:acyl-ACP--UDP-N-acetylglucosamine O-acyltransferase [Calycomorphotria hydatis]|uniref:Acyl-[acyl-carrier-protein]--UDP-N-acetylglucosamine O-acyltransferase n=1 Tax=Calycomorphotria hydatis TaxID=2528027 RepID=A0A517T3Y8_9PLAN|nr:acyl-ACP--UDP-N-acetylglucosamine O-acyltransferase [Calycomorphotria hydatis]QDT63093.1 Acyl-[acyl-carrier-protein]--UDP-N-acetylglucosamine O-acyltransferase [Calycomorphotria hydatis]